jgi:hypothetical protein
MEFDDAWKGYWTFDRRISFGDSRPVFSGRPSFFDLESVHWFEGSHFILRSSPSRDGYIRISVE